MDAFQDSYSASSPSFLPASVAASRRVVFPDDVLALRALTSLSLSLSTFGKNDTNFLEEIHSAARYKATGRGRGSQIAMGQRRDRARDEIERERCPPLEFSDSVLSFHDWKRSPNCRN